MPGPLEEVTLFPETHPILETDVALAANASYPVSAAGSLTFIDVYDVLRMTRRTTGFAGGAEYTRDPDLSEPFYIVDWFIHAHGAALSAALGPAPTPGTLKILGGSIDQATGGVNTGITDHYLANIPYSGPPMDVQGFYAGDLSKVRYLHGSFRARARMLAAHYVNGGTDQTVFHLGVAVRPL